MNHNSSLEPLVVSISVLNQMFLYLSSLGVDCDAFLRSLNIDPGEIKSPDTYIPIETYLRIQDEAAHYTNDPYFGLHMGEFAEAGSWSILGYLMMNCRTLGEAFEKASRYERIIGNIIEAKVQIRLNKVKVIYYTPPHAPAMSRHCYESTFSSSMRMMHTLTGLPLSPTEVTFIYPRPESIAEYDRIFHCPVKFEQKENSVTIEMKLLNTPVRMANPGLLDYFEQYARSFLAEMDRKDEYTRAATRIILSQLDDENLTIEKVAREMSVSVRTLQKHLEDEGIVFSDLMRDIRTRLAKKYLCENYTVEQITYMLGFSEPSAFRKAFKKWAGATPGEYRLEAVKNIRLASG
jgi:AraC-like DNA-binding protein